MTKMHKILVKSHYLMAKKNLKNILKMSLQIEFYKVPKYYKYIQVNKDYPIMSYIYKGLVKQNHQFCIILTQQIQVIVPIIII